MNYFMLALFCAGSICNAFGEGSKNRGNDSVAAFLACPDFPCRKAIEGLRAKKFAKRISLDTKKFESKEGPGLEFSSHKLTLNNGTQVKFVGAMSKIESDQGLYLFFDLLERSDYFIFYVQHTETSYFVLVSGKTGQEYNSENGHFLCDAPPIPSPDGQKILCMNGTSSQAPAMDPSDGQLLAVWDLGSAEPKLGWSIKQKDWDAKNMRWVGPNQIHFERVSWVAKSSDTFAEFEPKPIGSACLKLENGKWVLRTFGLNEKSGC